MKGNQRFVGVACSCAMAIGGMYVAVVMGQCEWGGADGCE